MNSRLIVAVLLLIPLYLSCGKKEQQQSDVRSFPLQGEVVGIDPSKTAVTIAHGEVPGYMMAMTMPFSIKDSSLLTGVDVGDSITATLKVSTTERWIEAIKITRKGSTGNSPVPESK